MQNKTSIWVLDKQRWIQGPRIPNELSGFGALDCVQALNSTTAIIISKDSALSYFNFKTWEWTWSEIRILPGSYDFDMISCVTTQNKLGEMFIYIMEREMVIEEIVFPVRFDINTQKGTKFSQ